MVNSRNGRCKILLLADSDEMGNEICVFCASVHQALSKDPILMAE